MAGISTKAAGSLTNKYQYNGKELENKEFSDGSGLEWTNFGARMYDQQIGRWHCTDGKAELYQNITPFAYAANQPTNAIDPDGNLIIFINGWTTDKAEQGTERYWRKYVQYKIMTQQNFDLNGNVYDKDIMGEREVKAFDKDVSNRLDDQNRRYVHGGNVEMAGDRYEEGIEKGYDDAASVIESIRRTDGTFESIKIITHSMGGVFGHGYVRGLKRYLNEHPELKKDVKISLIADFDPYQGGAIINSGKIKKQQITHKNKWSLSGFLANESEKGDYEYHESPTEGSHKIITFIDDIPLLKEGTYTWNDQTQEWDLQQKKK